ncbi:MAG TPA: hypothetical protein VFN21_08200 [Acidimicrobiales bacterium]|nr:hypothetical protein [Acidimicrobiales bacterium]
MPFCPSDSSHPGRGLASSVATAILWLLVLCVIVPPQADAAVREPGRPRLLVIGDSIILGTHGNIAVNLPDWDVVFDADVSRSTAAGLDVLASHGTDFSVVVVALGANDGGTPGVFAPRVAALLDALAPVPHVVWLTVHEARPYYAQTNAIIRDQVARHPNAVVGDWNAALRPGAVGADGLHLTGQGSAEMAAWVAGLVRLVAAPPPTTTSTTTTTTTTVPPTTTTSTTVAPATSTQSVRSVSGRNAVRSAADADGSGASWMIWGIPVIVVVLGGVALVITRVRRRAQ